MRSSKAQQQILLALAAGWTLKSHRYLTGFKVYRLHSLDGRAHTAPRRAVNALIHQGLIESNMKFPAATYLLTEKGKAAVLSLTESTPAPSDFPLHSTK